MNVSMNEGFILAFFAKSEFITARFINSKSEQFFFEGFIRTKVDYNVFCIHQHVTFLLPRCVVIDCFLNNQPDALIIPILFCYKILHVSGIFSAHHQEFSTVHSPLVSFMQVSDDRFEAGSGWNCSGSGHQKPA
jgi:hypothetical protein